MGHGRQQARRARLSLASGGHNYLARLPRVCQLVAARQTRAHPHLGAQRAGRSDRSKDRTAEADARSREGGAHSAQITSGTASGIPAHVRPAGKPASRGGTLAFTACYASMDGSRHQDGRPAGVAAGAAGSSRTGRTARMAGRTCESREPRGDDRDHQTAGSRCSTVAPRSNEEGREGTRTPRRSFTSASEPKPWSTARPACSPTPDLIARV